MLDRECVKLDRKTEGKDIINRPNKKQNRKTDTKNTTDRHRPKTQ